jgi:hypothetical protein
MRPILVKPVLVVPVGSHARRGNPIIGSAPVGTLVRRIGDAEGAAGAFSPDDLAGLEGWWKADSLVLADGDPVATWTDSSGNGRDATQGTASLRPTYRTNVVNGLPIVRGDESDDSLVLPDFLTGFTAGTLFWVAKVGADPPGGDNSAPALFFGSHGSDEHWPWTDGNIYYGFGSTVRHTVGDLATSLADAFRVWANISAASDWRVYLNGSLEFSTITNTVGFGTTPTMFRAGTGARFRGDVAEILVYSRALSDTERQQVEDYLMDKYGL